MRQAPLSARRPTGHIAPVADGRRTFSRRLQPPGHRPAASVAGCARARPAAPKVAGRRRPPPAGVAFSAARADAAALCRAGRAARIGCGLRLRRCGARDLPPAGRPCAPRAGRQRRARRTPKCANRRRDHPVKTGDDPEAEPRANRAPRARAAPKPLARCARPAPDPACGLRPGRARRRDQRPRFTPASPSPGRSAARPAG